MIKALLHSSGSGADRLAIFSLAGGLGLEIKIFGRELFMQGEDALAILDAYGKAIRLDDRKADRQIYLEILSDYI